MSKQTLKAPGGSEAARSMARFVVWSPILFAVCAGTVLAAEPSRILVVPAADRPLRVALDLTEPVSDPGSAWALVELDGMSKPVPATLAVAPGADGQTRSGARQVLATVPPRAGADGLRRFRLKPGPSDEAEARFRFGDINDKSLGLWENDRPVLVYNHGIMSKAGVPADRNRSTYIHPIYGLDGEVLTDDFPKDHYHHRGLFWAWPHVRIGGKHYDLWAIEGLHQRFERWLGRSTGPGGAVLGIENGWYAADKKLVQERVWLRVYPIAEGERSIDVDLTWIPLTESVTLEGAEGKSYGGLTLRFARPADVIATPLGQGKEDLTVTRLPWADLSARLAPDGQLSGAALFISPDHPDYPPTWLTRHYGVLCVGWPGVKQATFKPGELFRCRYGVWIHRGAPSTDQVRRAYELFTAGQKVAWGAEARIGVRPAKQQ